MPTFQGGIRFAIYLKQKIKNEIISADVDTGQHEGNPIREHRENIPKGRHAQWIWFPHHGAEEAQQGKKTLGLRASWVRYWQ